MKIGIKKKKNLIYLLLIGIVFLDLNCFGLVSPALYSDLCNGLNRTGQVIMVFLILLLLGARIKKKFFWTYITVYLVVIALICGAFSILEYNQTVYDIYVMLNCYIIMILIPTLYERINVVRVMKLITIMVSFALLIDIVQSITYNFAGIIFVKNLDINELHFRNNLLRGNNTGLYAPTISLLFLGNEKNAREQFRLAYRVIFVIMSLISMLFCGQTRSVIIAFVVAAVVTLLIKKERIDGKFLTLIITVIVVGIALQNSQVQYMIGSLTNENTVDFGTINVRMDNIMYRLSFLGKNPIFGMGIIRGIGVLKLIALGPQGLFYSSDVGVIDIISTFGVFGILLLVLIYGHWVGIIWKLVRRQKICHYAWYVGIVVFYLVNGLTISFFAPDIITCFAIINLIMVTFCETEFNAKLHKR